MKKRKLHLFVLIASIILIILNILTTDKFDIGFWFRIIANVFIILGIIRLFKSKQV